MPYSVMHDLLFTDYEAVSRRFYGQDIGVDINSVASLLSLQHHTAYDVLAKDYIQLPTFYSKNIRIDSPFKLNKRFYLDLTQPIIGHHFAFLDVK